MFSWNILIYLENKFISSNLIEKSLIFSVPLKIGSKIHIAGEPACPNSEALHQKQGQPALTI